MSPEYALNGIVSTRMDIFLVSEYWCLRLSVVKGILVILIRTIPSIS